MSLFFFILCQLVIYTVLCSLTLFYPLQPSFDIMLVEELEHLDVYMVEKPSFSKSFDIIGYMELYLYDLPSFSAIFHTRGTRFTLKLIRSKTISFLGSYFSIAPVIRLDPDAFFGLILVLLLPSTFFGMFSSSTVSHSAKSFSMVGSLG